MQKTGNTGVSNAILDDFFNCVRKESIEYLMPSRVTKESFYSNVRATALRINRNKFKSAIPSKDVFRTANNISKYQWERRMAIRLSSPEFRQKGKKTIAELTMFRKIGAQVLRREGYEIDDIAEIIGKSPQTIRKYLNADVGSLVDVIDSDALFKKIVPYRKNDKREHLFTRLIDEIGISDSDRTSVLLLLTMNKKTNLPIWSNYINKYFPNADILDFTGRFSTKAISSAFSRMDGDYLMFIYDGHGLSGTMYASDKVSMSYEKLFQSLRRKGKSIIVITTACYGGSAVYDFRKVLKGYSQNAVLITGCQSYEVAYHSREEKVSWFLLSLLKYDELPEELYIHGNGKWSQHPEITIYKAEENEFYDMKLWPQYALKETDYTAKYPQLADC